MTDYSTMVSMPLKAAYLCEDCHCVGNCSTGCIACASRALLSLKGVLNREPIETPAIKWPLCYCGGVVIPNPSGDITRTCIRCGSIVKPIDDSQTGEQPHSD